MIGGARGKESFLSQILIQINDKEDPNQFFLKKTQKTLPHP